MQTQSIQEILKMNGVRARNTVRELDDRPLLKELLKKDSRAIVRRAVEARMEKIGDEPEVEETEEVEEVEASEETETEEAAPAKKAKTKRVNIQDGVPDGERKCPKCLTVGGIDELFGRRNMKYKTKDGEKVRSVPQSYCRACRSSQRKSK